MSSFYGGGRIAQATVKVTPDLTGFQAELQAAVNKAFAGVQVPPVGGAGGKAAAGLNAATVESNALRGSLIGLSRVTPVTVFGLGLYGTAGIAAGLAIKTLVSETSQFESQLNTLQAITGASDAQLEQIRQTAISLGGDVSLAAISAKDAADALTELAKAGLSVHDSLAAVRGVLELAGAAEISAGTAARFVATELNAFHLSGDQATRVVDLLASASIAAQGSIEDFGNAFQQVSAVSAQAGLTVEQTTAALTELAKAGITSSDAGTSLRTFLLRLIPTTKQAGQFVQALGVQLDSSKTEGEQLSSVIEQYRSALLSLNPVQRTAVLNQIFGQDAIRAASVLLSQNTGELDRQIDALDNAGVAAELNRAKAEGLSGAFKGLQSNMETLGIKVGEVVSGPLEGLIRNLTGAADGAADLVGQLSKLADVQIPIISIPFELVDKTPDKGGGLKGALANLFKNNDPKQAIAEFKLILGGDFLKLKPGESPLAAFRRLHPIKVDTPTASPKELDDTFGLGGFIKGAEFRDPRAFQKAADRFSKNNKKRRAAVQALLDAQGLGKGPNKVDFDVTPSLKLQADLLNAQLGHSLQQELAADKNIRAYFERRLALAKEGTVRYTKILGALRSADSAVQSVQDQINSERDKALKEQADALKKRREDAAKLAKAQIDLQNEILDTKLSAAELTETKADDIRVYNSQIQRVRDDIDRQKKIANAAKRGSQARIDALIQIQTDLQKINGLKATIKGLKEQGANGGFSLEDLFKESVNQLNEFGSNVSTGVTIGGGARAAVAGAIAARDRNLSPADRAKLLATATTNDLLAEILAAIENNSDGPKGTRNSVRDKIGPADFATAAHTRNTTSAFGGRH